MLQRMFIRVLLGWAFIWGICAPVYAENFPKPESLDDAVAFWKKIYSKVGNDYGYLHHDRDLGLIFKKIYVPQSADRNVRKLIIREAKDALKKQLYRIADQPLARLSGDDLKLRGRFPVKANAAVIKTAARHIRFQRGQADRFEKAVGLSTAFMPYIRQQFIEAKLPVELSALPFVESSFQQHASSHAGAAGIWQFMPYTGRRFMKVDHIVDERYDVFRATRAAVKLLAYNHGILKNWPLALTAYNHGVGGMSRAVRKTGSRDIGVIVKKYRSRTFGFASRNFYAEFLAALEISRHPERYFRDIDYKKPVEYMNFRLEHYVPAAALAAALGVSIRELQVHNRGLRQPIWNGEKHIPARYNLRIARAQIKAPVKQLLASIPDSMRYTQQVSDKSYIVRRGDSLSRIAVLYKIRMNDLVAMNNLRSRHRIYIGQRLLLPQKSVPLSPLPAIADAPERPPPPVAEVIKPVVVAATKVNDVKKSVLSGQKTKAQERLAESEPGFLQSGENPVEDSSAQQLEATDPSDYSVADDATIEIQANETLGHYADWLQSSSRRLRAINGYSHRDRLIIGKRFRLEFGKVSADQFTRIRQEYHKDMEDAFFAVNQITGTQTYKIREGEYLWALAREHLKIPLWLLRQYNPDIDFDRLKPGDTIIKPVIHKKSLR